ARLDQGLAQKRRAAALADACQIRRRDAALALYRVASHAATLAAKDLRPGGGVARRRFHDSLRLAERAHVSVRLAGLVWGHGIRPGHFSASNAVLYNFEERGVIGRVRKLGSGQHGSPVAFALGPVAPSAVDLEKFLPDEQIGAAAREL